MAICVTMISISRRFGIVKCSPRELTKKNGACAPMEKSNEKRKNFLYHYDVSIHAPVWGTTEHIAPLVASLVLTSSKYPTCYRKPITEPRL